MQLEFPHGTGLDFSPAIGNSAQVSGPHSAKKQLLDDLLKQTSRSFYLTLRVLPQAIRPQISLAYLLARTTDTIADTEIVPVPQRLAVLQKLRDRIRAAGGTPLELGVMARHQGSTGERLLLEQVEVALDALGRLATEDLRLVRLVLETIISGQELDLQRFGTASGENIIALQNDPELDDYTYRVAGCVGDFWTRMCRTHLFPRAKINDPDFLVDAIRFGKGLQLVNILRDLPADAKKGRCYLPADKLAEAGLTPADLLSPVSIGKLRPHYDRYLDRAEAHLAAGWNYTNTIPRGQMRVRLACAWPVLIGVKTLQRLRTENVLDGKQRVKVSRSEVRQIMLQSLLRYPFDAAWRKLAAFPTRQR